jgi:hypothetical protein
MSQLTEYTIEVYKADRRIKEGRRLVEKKEFAACTRDYIDTVVDCLRVDGFIPELHETYVTRVNMMSGLKYQERYDTPRFCSPSSESYWSM